MATQFKVWGSENVIEVTDPKNFIFPHTGDRVLLKSRPPIAKTIKTD